MIELPDGLLDVINEDTILIQSVSDGVGMCLDCVLVIDT